MNKPIAWTIAGCDASGGAGLQADLLTFHHLGVEGCSVLTASTAQNSKYVADIQYSTVEHLKAQLITLSDGCYPDAIKIGMVAVPQTLDVIREFLQSYPGYVVCDPVLAASSGRVLMACEMSSYLQGLRRLFPYLHLLTPNITEAECISGIRIRDHLDVETAAQTILSQGVNSVCVKGGHLISDAWSQDFWTNGKESFWLSSPRYSDRNCRGTGCVFSSAVTACLALGQSLKDALVIAKMYVNRGIRLSDVLPAATRLVHAPWPEDQCDLPYLSGKVLKEKPRSFFSDKSRRLGLYPVVASYEWVRLLLSAGVKTIQLRCKNLQGKALNAEIRRSVELARRYEARLFINDYWEEAIAEKAYGVHLGQEDLNAADLDKIHSAGLRLGISTHCYYEVARAHAIQPTYMACGPIYPTTSKTMSFAPQGIDQLMRWRRTLACYPLVAIGGINVERIREVLNTGVDGVAMISAITEAENPEQVVRRLLSEVEMS